MPAVLASVSAGGTALVELTTADGAQPAFGAVGLHLSWQAYALNTFALVMAP